MKLSLIALVGTMFFVVDSQSDPVSDLARVMAPQIQVAKLGLSTAAKLKEKLLPAGAEISEAQCLDIRSRIEANYPVSPFAFIHKRGSMWAAMCGKNEYGSQNHGQFFFSDVSLISNFRLPIKYMVSFKSSTLYGGSSLTSYLLDPNYSIVEIQTEEIALHPGTGKYKTSTFEISSVDASRNVYRNLIVAPDWNLWTKGRQYFTTASAEVSGVHLIRKRRSEYPEMEIDLLAVTHRKPGGWDAAFVIPTFAWFSPVFKFGNEFIGEIPNSSWFSQYSSGGKEVCSEGHSVNGASLIRYEVPGAKDSCFNQY